MACGYFKNIRPTAIAALLLPLLAILTTNGQADTPQPRIELGRWAGDLKITPEANAAGRDLRGSEFVGQDLRNAVFDRADLYGVHFWDCDLSGTSFRGADLTGAFIDECGRGIEGADFTDAVIAGLRTDSVAYLSPQQLLSTRSYKTKDLHGCVISAYVRGSPNARPKYDFRGASLVGARLAHGDFRDCDFADARIDRIEMVGCIITFEQLASTKTFKDGRLWSMKLYLYGAADFSGLDLTRSELRLRDGRQAKLTNAIIKGSTVYRWLTKEQLYSTRSYQEGDLAGTKFQDVDMSKWDLSRQNLTDGSFIECTFAETNLEDAVITDVYGLQDSKGLTLGQIKSTWNYKHERMEGIRLPQKIADAIKREAKAEAE